MADPDEPLDVYDAAGTWLGVKGRAAVHRDGDWHRCFHLWVLSGDAVLLQRRARDKGSWPGMLDATAAGHVGAGESVEEGGAREVEEELGAHYAPGELVQLGVHAMADRGGVRRNCEFQHVALVEDPRPLGAWTAFDRGELDGLVRVDLPSFAALAAGGAGPWPSEEWDGTRVAPHELRPDEVVPAGYLPRLAPLLLRFAAGERTLGFGRG